MGLTNVTRSVEWAQFGGSWSDITGDVQRIEVVLQSLDQGMSNFTIEVDNSGGKYKDIWPAFTPNEKGLFYFVKIKFAGQRILVGRFEGVDPTLSSGLSISLDGLIVGGVRLSKNYGSFNWQDKKWDDAVEDILKWLDPYGVMFDYSSAHTGTLITMQPVDDYCHDIIRKICESEGVVGTLRPHATIESKVVVDLFVKNDAARRHNTIFKSILPDQSNVIESGNMPRDLKESANILDVVGGKSTQAPVDGDAWTESMKGWHKDGDNFALSLEKSITCNPSDLKNLPEDATVSTASIAATPFVGVSGPLKFHLTLPEVLGGELFNAALRKASLIQFRWTCGYVGFPGITGLMLGLVDANGTEIEADAEGWFPRLLQSGEWDTVQQRIGSDMKIWDFMSVHLHKGEWYYTGEGDVDKGFDWSKIRELYLVFDSATPFITPILPLPLYLPIYIDRLLITQDFIPKVRVSDSDRVNKYESRMQPIEAPEIYELGPLKAYANKLLKASAQPTFILDVTVLHDPATEIILPAYGIRFDWPAHGISSSLWWRGLAVHYIWDLQQGFRLRIQAVPATLGSEDYSNVLATKTWTGTNEGLLKNLIGNQRKIRDFAERLGVEPLEGH